MTDKTENRFEARSVAGVTFDGTTTGNLDESEIPREGFEKHYLYDGKNKSNSKYPVVGADNKLYKGSVRSAQSVGARGGISDESLEKKLTALAKEFDPPLELTGTDEDDDDDEADGEASLVTGRIAANDISHEEDSLRGVVWASGTHSLFLNGKPTTVHVPPETIEPTFERLTDRIEAGEVGISFDHPESDSVAATTPVGELGLVEDVSLDKSGERIVMTDSAITNNKAQTALEAGDFDGYDYSVVGSFGIKAAGSIPDDAEAQLSSVDIRRVDVVPTGAVSEAKVNREIPPLAAALADIDADRPAPEYANQLRAAAGTDVPDETMRFNTDVDSIEAAKSELSTAADVVDEKEEQIESLQDEKEGLEADKSDLAEYKEAFQQIAAAFDLDPTIEDDGLTEVRAAAVDVVTEDLREEVAEIEAALPSEDLSSDEIDERMEALKGTAPDELEARAGELARKFRTTAVGDGTRPVSRREMQSSESNSEAVEQMANSSIDMFEAQKAKDSGQSAAQFIRDEYDLDPGNFGDRHALQEAMSEVRVNGGAE